MLHGLGFSWVGSGGLLMELFREWPENNQGSSCAGYHTPPWGLGKAEARLGWVGLVGGAHFL